MNKPKKPICDECDKELPQDGNYYYIIFGKVDSSDMDKMVLCDECMSYSYSELKLLLKLRSERETLLSTTIRELIDNPDLEVPPIPTEHSITHEVEE